MSDDLERARERARERRADEVMEFLGAEPVPDDYEPDVESPIDGLRYSERKLWNECPEARPALERSARQRAELKRVEAELRMTRIAAGSFSTKVHSRGLKLDDTQLVNMAREFLDRISGDDE